MKLLLIVFLLLSTPALAQQQPDPMFLQRALAVVQAQRNQALDAVAGSEAKVSGLTDELAKATAQIKALRDKYEPVDKKDQH
jgi:hypothetical protein